MVIIMLATFKAIDFRKNYLKAFNDQAIQHYFRGKVGIFDNIIRKSAWPLKSYSQAKSKYHSFAQRNIEVHEA